MHGVLLANPTSTLELPPHWRRKSCCLVEWGFCSSFVWQSLIHYHLLLLILLLLHHIQSFFIYLLFVFSFVGILIQVTHILIYAHRQARGVNDSSSWWIDGDLHLSWADFAIKGVAITFCSLQIILVLLCRVIIHLHLLKLLIISISFKWLIQLKTTSLWAIWGLPSSYEAIHSILVEGFLAIATVVTLRVVEDEDGVRLWRHHALFLPKGPRILFNGAQLSIPLWKSRFQLFILVIGRRIVINKEMQFPISWTLALNQHILTVIYLARALIRVVIQITIKLLLSLDTLELLVIPLILRVIGILLIFFVVHLVIYYRELQIIIYVNIYREN